ncbi:hypothetical protein EST38_g2986 [Candolleomyces aberdarensis]|uniref:DUF3752 domain-containing protein n=1 Tax=Candolleomyces aberdarensis TaxID=2316362 RepID=A0A4Q2DTC0_9AGAR|nr:hypothetical protein EST38_g2986 [Candolleomyces aberdarensis]
MLPPHLQHLLSSSSKDDEDDEEEVGPTVPTLGPQLPPRYGQTTITDDAEDEDEPAPPQAGIGPAIPAHLLNAKSNDVEDENRSTTPPPPPSIGPSFPTQSKAQPQAGPSAANRKAMGPALPNYGPTYNPSTFNNIEEDDDSDDDVGPKPLPAGMKHEESNAVKEFLDREERMRKAREAANTKSAAPKREEWMLVPPSNSDLLGNLDPSKLKKSRQFSKSTHANTGASSDMSLWTETPAERQQRLEDEVMGRKRRAVEAASSGPSEDPERKRRKQEEAAMKQGVDEYTKKIRGPSLVDRHKAATEKKNDQSDEPPVIWDHARDMGIGGRLMDDGKRNQLLREAKGLGDRFSSGFL